MLAVLGLAGFLVQEAQTVPTFPAAVELVTVDAVVLDRDGNAVAGLAREDFVVSEDGREKITGFHLRGELLGIDSFDMPTHACDAFALDTSEAWELPLRVLRERFPELLPQVATSLSGEIRRDWGWMLAISSLNAEQRVVAFLLDLASRLEALGFSPRHLLLRMTRAELGNFLALQLETVTRALGKLAAWGLIVVEGREIRLLDASAMRRMLAA